MSAQLQRLAELILSEHFGDTVTSVGLLLVRTGKRALRDIIKETKLRKDEVQKSVVVLMQHGLVSYEAGKVGLYSFNLQRLLIILHYPKYIAAVKPLYGDVSELVVEDLLCNGSSLLSSVVQRVAEKLEGKGTAHKDPQELAEMVKVAFHALVENSFVMRHTNRPSTAGGESSDETTSPAHQPAIAAFTLLPVPLLQGIVYRKRLRSDVDSSTLSEEEGEPTAKRLKRTEDTTEEEGSEPIDAGVQWVVNSERFLYQLKHSNAVAAVARRIDAVAGNVLNSLLKLAVAADPFCSRKETTETVFVVDVLRDLQTSGVRLTPEQLDQYLKILCDEKFLQHLGDGGGGAYGVNIKFIDRILCQSAIESIVRERFGPKSHRIFRLILLKKYLDQKQVADMAMLPQKEAKEMLYTLVAEHMVTIQEVPKSQDYAPARTFYLFSVNLQQVARVIVNRCYKALGNLMVKRKAEREEHRRLLEQQQLYKRRCLALEQQGGSEEEKQELEETLTPEERKMIERVQQALARLEQAELKVADTILLLTAFLES